MRHVILITFTVLALTAALVAPRCSVVHRNGRAWLVCPRNGAYLYEDWYPMGTTYPRQWVIR